MASEFKYVLNKRTGQWNLVPTNIVLAFKTAVASQAALPLTGNAKGDARIANDAGHLYVWSIEDSSGLLTDWVDAGDIVDLNWSAISGKPSSSVSNIDDAVSKKHTQGTDQGLDTGGANAVTAAQVKQAVTDDHSHSNKSILDNIQEALTTVLKAAYDGAVSVSHAHTNKTILDNIQEALTTVLKAAYDAAVTHSGLTSGNPHNVSKSDVGLGSVDNKSEATIIADVKVDADIADALSKKHDATEQFNKSADSEISGLDDKETPVDADVILAENSVASEPTLDQEQTSEESDQAFSSTAWVGQVFKAGMSGSLTKVVMKLFKQYGTSDVIVEIQDVVDGKPGGSVLATKTISESIIGESTPGIEVDIVFDTPTAIVSGNSYAIVLKASAASSGRATRRYTSSDLYPNGVLCTYSAGVWSPRPGTEDAYFKTYVDLDIPAFSKVKLSWANIKATLKTYFDSIYQAALGFTAENSANKKTTLADDSDTYYPSQKAVKSALDAKQATLVSGTNIKTINSTTLLGSGDLVISGTDEKVKNVSGDDSAGYLAEKLAALYPSLYQRDQKWALKTPYSTAANRYTVLTPAKLSVDINGTVYFLTAQAEVDLSSAANWDTTSPTNYTTAANRAGKDFYIYACVPVSGSAPKIVLSANSTTPSGYTSSNSRKIGGFHGLCKGTGTNTSGVTTALDASHPAYNFDTGDVIPISIWDLDFKPSNNKPEGRAYVSGINRWVDIYLPSGTGTSTVSVYGGTISDTRDWNDFTDDGADIGMRMLNDPQFQEVARGSNEQTNISGSADPGTTGGHVDTAGRRMISNYFIEDACGVEWQWLDEQSSMYSSDGAGWYDLPGDKGQLYRPANTNDVKLVAGGSWDDGVYCGSRGRRANLYRWYTGSDFGCRFCAEPV